MHSPRNARQTAKYTDVPKLTLFGTTYIHPNGGFRARLSELRTATSYARFLKDQSRWVEALAVLKPVYEWFTEGFDSKDLKEAKALLEELK